MIWETALHYARFWLVLVSVSGELQKGLNDQIVGLHNLYRSMVSPKAADMQKMEWDESLALVAEEYAAKCIWEHNEEVIERLGENLLITTRPLDINISIARWFDEHRNYDYATNTCPEGICGHYIQLVWAKSTAVGCGSHFCNTVQLSDYENATILVCNYNPPGNVEGEKPYEEGEPCSKCPRNTACTDNICTETEGSTEESRTDTPWSSTDTPWSSAALKKLSVASLLACLMVSFIF